MYRTFKPEEKEEATYYDNLIKCIRSNQFPGIYKKIEPFKDNIKIIFDEFPNIESSLYWNYPYNLIFFRKTMRLVEALKDEKIDKRVIDVINCIHKNMPLTEELINELTLIYAPQLLLYNFTLLLNTCDDIYWESDKYFRKHRIDTGNEFLDNLYKFLQEIWDLTGNNKKNIMNYYDIHKNHLVTIMILYLQCNKMFNRQNIIKYLDNYDYYLERLILNDLNIDSRYVHTLEDVKKVFDNFDMLFNEHKAIIK